MELWFRGADLDRLLDEGHAALVGAVASRLASLGWEVRPEVSFAVYAERGSIDLVEWHAADIPPCEVDDGIDLHGETGTPLSGR